MKKYKSDTKHTVEISIKIIGISSNFLSTSLTGADESNLYCICCKKQILVIACTCVYTIDSC